MQWLFLSKFGCLVLSYIVKQRNLISVSSNWFCFLTMHNHWWQPMLDCFTTITFVFSTSLFYNPDSIFLASDNSSQKSFSCLYSLSFLKVCRVLTCGSLYEIFSCPLKRIPVSLNGKTEIKASFVLSNLMLWQRCGDKGKKMTE